MTDTHLLLADRIEKFLKDNPIPNGYVHNGCETINDGKLFAERHLLIMRENRKWSKPYSDRLVSIAREIRDGKK